MRLSMQNHNLKVYLGDNQLNVVQVEMDVPMYLECAQTSAFRVHSNCIPSTLGRFLPCDLTLRFITIEFYFQAE